MIDDLLSHQLSEAQENFLRKSTQGITLAAILFIGPFAIYHFLRGEIFLALCATFMLAVIAYSAWNTLAGHLSYKLSFSLLTPAFLLFSWVAIEDLGVIGVLWSYPALIMFYFIFPERLARAANLALLLVVLPRTFMVIDTDIALRTSATLAGVSLLCSIFVRRLNAQQLELEEMATRDPLTLLSNRLNFHNRLDAAIAYSHARGYPLSILMLDIDQFSQVNEAHGYAIGDSVLQAFGGLLVKKTLSADEVFRLGGEEFLVVLNGLDNKAAGRIAAEIHEGLRQAHLEAGVKLRLSIGMASLQPGETRYDLLQRCDQQLRAAKQAGGDCTLG